MLFELLIFDAFNSIEVRCKESILIIFFNILCLTPLIFEIVSMFAYTIFLRGVTVLLEISIYISVHLAQKLEIWKNSYFSKFLMYVMFKNINKLELSNSGAKGFVYFICENISLHDDSIYT